ncbi:hypothetical protein F0562_018300 [Nyssa sinensis]|uniref:Uncharacterized protein n=1 Tax=Nyssa sinensis TaxID=561372 RepID=A0A5J4ZCZ5_9ASTE|nr:hypothetical protein F0562_018300 [Nyssa sinensis]
MGPSKDDEQVGIGDLAVFGEIFRGMCVDICVYWCSVGARDVAAGAVHGDFPEQLVLREQELGLDVEDFSPLVDGFPDLIQLVAPKMAVAEMRFGMEFWWKKF